MGLALLAVVLLVLGLTGLGAFWFVMFRNTGADPLEDDGD